MGREAQLSKLSRDLPEWIPCPASRRSRATACLRRASLCSRLHKSHLWPVNMRFEALCQTRTLMPQLPSAERLEYTIVSVALRFLTCHQIHCRLDLTCVEFPKGLSRLLYWLEFFYPPDFDSGRLHSKEEKGTVRVQREVFSVCTPFQVTWRSRVTRALMIPCRSHINHLAGVKEGIRGAHFAAVMDPEKGCCTSLSPLVFANATLSMSITP